MGQNLAGTFRKLMGITFFLIFLIAPLCLLFSNSKLMEIPIRLIFQNLLQAFLSAIFSILLALPLAYALTKSTPLAKILSALTLIPLVLPQPALILSLIVLFGANGIFILPVSLFSLYGIVLAHSLYNFPLAARLIATRWSYVKSYDVAARTLGANRLESFIKIILPSLKPSLVSGFIISFSFSFTSFAIPMVFGGIANATLEVEIFRSFFRDFNFAKGAFLAFLQMLIFLPIIFAWKKVPWSVGISASEKSNLAFAISAIYALLFAAIFGAPFLKLKLIGIALQPIINSLLLASSSALLSVTLWVIFGKYVKKYAFLMLAISPAVLAISYYYLPAIPMILLPIGHAMLSFPLVALAMLPFLKDLASYNAAAASLGANGLRRFFNIELPIQKKPYLLAFLLAFGFSLGETAFVLSVGNGFDTMSSVLVWAFSSYRFGEGYYYVSMQIIMALMISFSIDWFFSDKKMPVFQRR